MIDQILLLVRQLTISQRIGIVFGAALTVLMTVGLVMWAGQPQMQAAFTNVATSDAATITAALTSAGIPYTLDNGGATISVPAAKVADAKIAANQAGFTGADASGFDLFNQQAIGASAFDQQVQLQRAIQNQLATTIKKFDGVADATVTIVFSKTGITTTSDQPASASVWVKMAGGAEPSPELVQSIVATAAGSVPGLSTSNVAVVDAQGNALAGPNNAVSTALSIQASTERTLRQKAQYLLDNLLGVGNSEVQLTANLNLDQIERTVTTVQPVDTNHWTPTGVQNTIETYGGTGANGAGGIPGTTSNVPGLPTYPNVPVASASPSASPGTAATPAPSAGAYLKSSETVNYANSTDVAKIVSQPGAIKQLTAAVLVDSAALKAAGLDEATLSTLLANALNMNTVAVDKGGRGDAIPVKAVTFAAAAAAVTAPGPDIFKLLGGVLPTVGGALLALALLFLVWRNMAALRGRAEDMQLVAARMSMPALAMGEMGTTSMADRPMGMPGYQEEGLPQLPESPQAKIGERLRQLAEQDPDEVANLVRSMLDEDERATRRR